MTYLPFGAPPAPAPVWYGPWKRGMFGCGALRGCIGDPSDDLIRLLDCW